MRVLVAAYMNGPTMSIFKPVLPPRPYQRGAVAWLAKRGYGALLLDTRTGKTKIAIDWLAWLAANRGVQTIVIICPKVAIDVWQDELTKNWWGDPYQLYDLRRERSTQSSSRNKWWPSAKQWRSPALRIVLINHERFSVACQDILKGIGRLDAETSAIILDESHVIKRPSSKRSRRITRLGRLFKYRAILTATPVSKRNYIDEIYPQWCFMDPSTRDRWPTAKSFRDYFGEWDDSMGFPRFVRPRHTAEYAQLIAENSISITREAALGLEPVKYEQIKVAMPDSLRALYKAMVNHPQVLAEEGIEPPEHIFGQFMLSQRMADGVVPRVDGSFRVWAHKLNEVKRLAAEVPRCIVCCNFLAELALLRRELKAAGHTVVTVSGATADKTSALKEFLNTGRAILLVQPSVVAVAVDLSCAERIVWYSVPTSWILFKQMSDRIALNPKSPTAYVVTTNGSSDTALYSTIIDARSYRTALLKAPQDFLLGECTN